MSINPGILKFRSNSECDTRRIAGLTARAIELAFNPAKGGAIFFLNGTLGAGKTFFVQALLTELGVAQEIVSPTFSICIPYRANGLDVWHMDAYRIEHDEEIEELGLDEAVDSGKLILVEWGEKIAKLAPPQDMDLKIEVLSESHREFQFLAKSELGRAIVSRIPPPN